MKTIFVCLAMALAAHATAQQRTASLVFNDNAPDLSAAHNPEPVAARPSFDRSRGQGAAARTTAASSRWYNYGDYLFASGAADISAMYLWNDTTSVDAFSGSLGHRDFLFNKMVSTGLVLDPSFYGFNDEAAYAGMMRLSPSDAYVIDSVFISGVYARNNSKPAPVDTLTLAVLYGDGTASSSLHYNAIDTSGGRSWIYDEYGNDSLFYMNMKQDTVNNHLDSFMGGAQPVIKKIFLTSADTSASYQAVIPVSISVPAGNLPAMSLSFKSGDASFVFGDTVFWGAGTTTLYRYGMFRPFIAYQGMSSSAAFPVNSRADRNEGQFRDAGADRLADGLYRPQWFWYDAASGGASTYQYPYFAFHISCAACGTVGITANERQSTVKAYPNPANDRLTISCGAEATSVTLTDMMGRAVAETQAISGIAQFHTSEVPAGIYLYHFVAAGRSNVGRVIITH